jgi:dTDP-4-amino-4,6-dideoxygalactose transaminase
VGPLEEEYLVRALRSGWVAPVGPDLTAFERETAERVGVAHAVAVSSGTAALHLALLAVGAGPGTVVVVPTLTFVATANAVRYTGAEPVFVDCNPATGNIDVAACERVLAATPVAAVMPVDLFGTCADYTALEPLCARHGVPLVEDAAEALGATHAGRAAGSFGRAGVLSFNGNKIMTTSGGGMLLTDDGALADRCRYLATQAREPVAHYEHIETGYNYRLSNLLAALGRAQLHRLDGMVERRRRVRAWYEKQFAPCPGVRFLGADDGTSTCWLSCLVVDPERAGWAVADLATALAAADVETRPLWKPMHRQPVYASAGAELTGAADRLFATGLALPSGSTLGEADLARIGGVVEMFLAERP